MHILQIAHIRILQIWNHTLHVPSEVLPPPLEANSLFILPHGNRSFWLKFLNPPECHRIPVFFLWLPEQIPWESPEIDPPSCRSPICVQVSSISFTMCVERITTLPSRSSKSKFGNGHALPIQSCRRLIHYNESRTAQQSLRNLPAQHLRRRFADADAGLPAAGQFPAVPNLFLQCPPPDSRSVPRYSRNSRQSVRDKSQKLRQIPKHFPNFHRVLPTIDPIDKDFSCSGLQKEGQISIRWFSRTIGTQQTEQAFSR